MLNKLNERKASFFILSIKIIGFFVEDLFLCKERYNGLIQIQKQSDVLNRLFIRYRAVERSENLGVPVLIGGHNLSLLVEIR